MLGEASEVVKQEKKETKKKRKKVQKEAVALNKDDPPPGYENVENNGRCEGCVGDSVPCAVEIDKLIAWRTGDSGVKAVCWRCKCKRKACDFGGDGSGAKGKAKEKTRATHLYRLPEDLKTWQLTDMAHMSRLPVCSLPTGSGPRESREKRAQMAKDPSSLSTTVSKSVWCCQKYEKSTNNPQNNILS
jgi:hypothetical protein